MMWSGLPAVQKIQKVQKLPQKVQKYTKMKKIVQKVQKNCIKSPQFGKSSAIWPVSCL